jgi:hypothetical protein
MALPHTVHVKLSSEAAGAISVTPVVVQQMPIRELLGHLLGVVGKNEARIREIIQRGSLVSGASRFRWNGWQTEPGALDQLLATFPDDDPSLPFSAERCTHAVLRGSQGQLRPVEIPRDTGRLWEALLELASSGLTYAGYSYREKADRYHKPVTFQERERLRAASAKLRFRTLHEQILAAAFEHADFYVSR